MQLCQIINVHGVVHVTNARQAHIRSLIVLQSVSNFNDHLILLKYSEDARRCTDKDEDGERESWHEGRRRLINQGQYALHMYMYMLDLQNA